MNDFTPELLRAFKEIRKTFPDVCIAVFDEDGDWSYMDKNHYSRPFLESFVDSEVLATAAGSIKNVPAIFEYVDRHDYYEDLATTAACVGVFLGTEMDTYHPKLGGLMSMYDCSKEVAKAFLEKYPPHYNWENSEEDWDSVLDGFAKQWIRENK